MNLWRPDIIVLGPGGAKGYLELGFLEKLEENNYIQTIDKWTGCSAGSIISLLYASGYTIVQIEEYFMDLNIINSIDDINTNISDCPGLLNAKSVENLIKRCMIQKFGIIPTLSQLYMATGILLKFVTYNVDKMEIEYLSKDLYPELSAVKAVMMSSAMPGILTPVIYRGHAYSDGAIGDPYPILLDDDGVNKILGVYIDSDYGPRASDKNRLEYIYRCYTAPLKSLREFSMKWASDNCKHVELKTHILDSTGLTITSEIKRQMIEAGKLEADKFLQSIIYPEINKILLNDNDEIPIPNDTNIDNNNPQNNNPQNNNPQNNNPQNNNPQNNNPQNNNPQNNNPTGNTIDNNPQNNNPQNNNPTGNTIDNNPTGNTIDNNPTGNTIDNTTGNTIDNTTGNTIDNTTGNTIDNTTGNTIDNTTGNTIDNTTGNTIDNNPQDNTIDNTTGNTIDNSQFIIEDGELGYINSSFTSNSNIEEIIIPITPTMRINIERDRRLRF
jgi:predicted acylesterase/phospholipase RssA